jgi:hypothetical protein
VKSSSIFVTCRTSLRSLATLVVATMIAACGGGGGGTDAPNANLYVNFNYADAGLHEWTVLKEQSETPQTYGLGDNHRPHYELVSGGLPAGLSLDPNTGVVSGRPISNGQGSAVIRMTVSGYSGSLDATFAIVVGPFWISYRENSDAAVGRAMTPNVPDMPDYDGAVSIKFAVKSGSKLPAGLTLDPTTGAVGGTPTQAGDYQFYVTATARNGGHEVEAEARLNYYFEAP